MVTCWTVTTTVVPVNDDRIVFSTYSSSSLGRLRLDIDECLDSSPCQHKCINLSPGFRCLCKVGYTLAEDQIRCHADGKQVQFVDDTISCFSFLCHRSTFRAIVHWSLRNRGVRWRKINESTYTYCRVLGMCKSDRPCWHCSLRQVLWTAASVEQTYLWSEFVLLGTAFVPTD